MTTDTSEKGMEEMIESVLLNSGYEKRTSKDFNTDYAIDEGMLRTFLESTQRDKVQRARIYDSEANTRKFYERLRGQITQRGIVDVLRQGVEHNATKWKSHTNLTHPGKYFRPSKVKIMRPTSPK